MRKFLICSLVNIMVIFIIFVQVNAEISSEKILHLSIRPSKTIYQFKEYIALDIELRNISNNKIHILRNIFPEGWLLIIKLTDKQGIRVYNSRLIKIEMTVVMLETIQLERDHFYGARLVIEKEINPGEYIIEA